MITNPRPVDDTAVNGQTEEGITSNWAYDHAVNYDLHKKVVRKTADQTLTQSNTTLQNVTDLLFAIGASEVWVFDMYILSNSGTTPDIKFDFAVPSGASGQHVCLSSAKAEENPIGTKIVVNGEATNVISAHHIIVINSTTAGNVQLQAAQDASDASDTKVLANSCIVATQLV